MANSGPIIPEDIVDAAVAKIEEIRESLPADEQSDYRVAQKLDVNSAHLTKLDEGRLSPTLYSALVREGHLEPLPNPIPTLPCRHCGQVHTVPWCAEEEGEPIKPKKSTVKRRQRKRRPRFSVAADDPELAMRQLEKYYPGVFTLNGHKE